MQKVRICYRNFRDEFRWTPRLRTGPEYGGNPLVVLHQLSAKLGGVFRQRAIAGRFSTHFDGGFQTGEKRLAWAAVVEVVFQFVAEGIVQLLVEIIG